MNNLFQILIRHGYTLLFLGVFGEQIGLPLPAEPLLLAAGAMAGERLLNFGLAFFLTVIASLMSDVFWYQLGLRRGSSVLSLLCRISLNPDSCVRHTLNIFSRHGAQSLLVAKFLPGVNTIAPPLAGILHMSLLRFLLFDGLGACIWVGFFSGLGYVFREQMEEIAVSAMKLGASLTEVVAGGLAIYIGWKYVQRRRFLRQLRIARISPEELKRKLDAGENLLVLDVRQSLELEAEPQIIAGALYLPLEKLEKDPPVMPLDREVILYCD